MKAKRLKQAGYLLLMVLGMFGMVGVWGQPDRTLEGGILSDIVATLGLFILGAGGLSAVANKYEGGVPTVVGALMAYFGLVSLCTSIEEFVYSELHAKEVIAGALATITLLGGGAALLWSGHKNAKASERDTEDAP